MMTKKTYVLLILAALLGAAYVYNFTDWINAPRIQIYESSRPIRFRRAAPNVYPVSFILDGHYKLTSVQVFAVADLGAQARPTPLWRLVSASNSVPTQGFFYGQRIRGMKPWRTNAPTKPLEPNVTYRLLVRAGRARGEVDFQPKPVAAESP